MMVTRRAAELIRSNWDRLGLPRPAQAPDRPPGDFQFLKVSGASGASKVVLFAFAGRDFGWRTSRLPVAVVKIATGESAARRMGAAHQCLQELHSRLTAPPSFAGTHSAAPEARRSLRASLPRPLALAREGSDVMALETYLPGSPMYRHYPVHASWLQRRRIRRDFELARSWLVRFHQATRAERPATVQDVQRSFAAALRAFIACHDPSSAEVAALEQSQSDLTDSGLPLVCQQGDYWPRNLLVLDSRIGVCDWEWCELAELPFLDVFIFLISYALLLGAARPTGAASGEAALVDRVRQALMPGTWLSRVCRDFASGYFSHMGIAPECAPALFHLALLHMSVRDYLATGQPSRTDRLHRSLLRVCVEQQLAYRGWLSNLGR